MKLRNLYVVFAVIVAVMCLAPNSKADNSLTLSGVGDGVNAAGVYVGPYQGTINGSASPIICDDFTHDSFVGENWTATATNLGTGNLANTLWGAEMLGAGDTYAQVQTAYDASAWLSSQLLSLGSTNSTQQIIDQFAIWQLFDPGADSGLSSALQGQINSLIGYAELSSTYNTINLSAFTIYTPDSGSGMCGSSPCSTTTPQEFLVNTPEPSTLLLLGLGLGCLGVVTFRRKKAEPSVLAI